MVIFDDIETALADYLNTELAERAASAPVVIGVPSERPKRFVRLVRVGGTQSTLITDRPRIVAECWDTVGVDAQQLGALVRALITGSAPGWISDLWVDKVTEVGFAFSPDPDTNLPRYLVTTELHVRGTHLH